MKRIVPVTLFFIYFAQLLNGQLYSDSLSFFQPSPEYNKTRSYTVLGFTSLTFAGFSYGLYNTWYKDYDQSSFHFFNDWGEWNNMDKAGHVYTAYLQGVLCYKGAKWAGLSDKDAILTGAICGTLFQTTVEVMDGFSTEWGFSLSDFGANALGVGAFAFQQAHWGEQKFLIKESSTGMARPDVSVMSVDGNSSMTLRERGNDLFGSSLPERYLKDYNNQTYWVSANVHSLLPKGNSWPSWLNVAVGYGSENLYGGFTNQWESDGAFYDINDQFPRYRQYYLSLDVDLSKIRTDNYFLKSVLTLFNIIKVPAPALEVTSQGEVIFHFLKF